MFGSGIYCEEITATFHCPTCEEDYELEGMTDDYHTMATAECEVCKTSLRIELDSNERDEDNDYDAWRESQME